jgi:hypothetical protein
MTCQSVASAPARSDAQVTRCLMPKSEKRGFLKQGHRAADPVLLMMGEEQALIEHTFLVPTRHIQQARCRSR